MVPALTRFRPRAPRGDLLLGPTQDWGLLNSDDALGRCNVDQGELSVIDLGPNPSQAELAAARRAYRRGHIVRMVGGTAGQLQRLLEVRSVIPQVTQSSPHTPQTVTPAELQVVAVRATAEGAMHEYHALTSGPSSADAGSMDKGFSQWVARERLAVQSKAAQGSNTPPDRGAWTELQEQTYVALHTYGDFRIKVAVYRLNDKNREKDWYLVTHSPETRPDLAYGCGTLGFDPCGWITAHRYFSLESPYTLYEHEPHNEITSTETSFEIGAGLSKEGPSAEVGVGFSWSQESVTTHDQTAGEAARWQEDFTLRKGGDYVPDTTKSSFESHQAAIFEVPEGTTKFDVKVNDSVNFVIQALNFNQTGPPLPGIKIEDTGDSQVVNLQVTIPVFAPVLAVSSPTITVPPGGQGSIYVSAAIPGSNQGFSWKVKTNQGWLTVPSPDTDFSGSESVTVTVAPGTAPGTPGGVVTIETDPPFAAPSVAHGPLQVQVVVGERPPGPSSGILLVGGVAHGDAVGLVELYDPANGEIHVVGSLNTPRFAHTATALQNGDVLIVGGSTGDNKATATAELYHAATGTISPVNGATDCGQGSAEGVCCRRHW